MRAVLRCNKRFHLSVRSPSCPAPSRSAGALGTLPVLRRPWAPPPWHRQKSHEYPSKRFFHATVSYSPVEESTIYALSTAPGRAAIAVIRVSGPACVEIYHALCPGRPLPKPRLAALRALYDPSQPPTTETVLDSGALVLYFPSPKTVTGEDVLELHVHGGPAVVKAVLSAIPRCSSTSSRIRYAEPGEFTRRAFMNDRMDLTQIEALGDTLSATTEQQRKLSVRGTTSGLAKRYESWRQQLLYARGELEALIDFSEDQHFDESPEELAVSVAAQVEVLRQHIEAHRANAVRGELLRNGISIALLGAPNAGKSSLLNRIVGREAAIVSQEAGTTRDVVEVGIDLGGWFCRLGDMAGLRKSMAAGAGVTSSHGLTDVLHAPENIVGAVEQEGIKRAKQRALESDVVIVVLSITSNADGTNANLELPSEVVETARQCLANGCNVLVAINKTDKLPDSILNSAKATFLSSVQNDLSIDPDRIFFISCKDSSPDPLTLTTPSSRQTQEIDPGNIQTFLTGLITTFQRMTAPLAPSISNAPAADPSIWHESLGATERHRLLLEECLSHLDAFLAAVALPSRTLPSETTADPAYDAEEPDVDIVIAAESLRAAADCLARITGKGEAGDVEEVLGVVFEK